MNWFVPELTPLGSKWLEGVIFTNKVWILFNNCGGIIDKRPVETQFNIVLINNRSGRQIYDILWGPSKLMVQKYYKLLKHHGWLDFFDTKWSDFIPQLIQFIRITLLLPVAFKISGIDPRIPKFIGRNDWLPYSPRHDLIENFLAEIKSSVRQ